MKAPHFIPVDPGKIMHSGVIYLANESRFNSGHLSDPLTDYAAAWEDAEGLRSMLGFVAPEVQVARRFEYAKGVNSAAVPSEADGIRAIGSDFKQVDIPTPHEFGQTQNKGLTVRIDRQGGAGTDCIEQMYVAFLMARLYRNDFRRAVAILDAVAASTSKTWAPTGEADPDGDVMDALISAETASGLAPNRVLFGQAAFRLRAKTLRERDHVGTASTAGLPPADLAPIYGVDGVRVSGHRFQGQPAAKNRIVPSAVYGFFGQDQASVVDASNLKRFVTPMDDGRLFRVHRHEVNAQFVDLTVEHYSDVVLTDSTGIVKLAIS